MFKVPNQPEWIEQECYPGIGPAVFTLYIYY